MQAVLRAVEGFHSATGREVTPSTTAKGVARAIRSVEGYPFETSFATKKAALEGRRE